MVSKGCLVVLVSFVSAILIYTALITNGIHQTERYYFAHQPNNTHLPTTTPSYEYSTPPTIKEISIFVLNFTETIRVGTVVEYFSRSWLGEALDTTNPVPHCSIKCYFNNRKIIDNADALILFSADGKRKSDYGKKILITQALEFPPSKIHWKNILRDNFGSFFQIAIQYHLQTDSAVIEGWSNALKHNKTILYIPVTAAWFSETEILEDPVPFEQKLNKAVLFVSNCDSYERNEYVEKLMSIMGDQIDSFGNCWPYNNEDDVIGCQHIDSKYEKKICILRQYKFSLSFENTIDESYVTEKYFQAGSVPVVWGAPNIQMFDPLYKTKHSYKSYIHANEVDPVILADQLKMIMNNKTLYEEYLHWKIVGIGDHFRELLSLRSTHEGVCNMCKAVAYVKKMERANKNKL